MARERIQNIGLLNWVVLLLVCLASVALARYANSSTGVAATIFLGLGFLVALLSYFQMGLETRERLERMEFDELKRSASSGSLFAQEADTFPAQRAREQFERFVVPIFTFCLLLVQGGSAYWLWGYVAQATPPTLAHATIAMALYALLALILFLLGKYSAGLARLEGLRLASPGASYLLLASFICFTVTVTEVTNWFEVPQVDPNVARALAVILGLAALETLVGLILEIYRPRVRGQKARLLYESRLIGLLAQPGGIITTAAQALDYQFGFKVSETWFYRFLEKAISWIILVQLGLLLLSTTVVIIEPGEQALHERFGHPVAGDAVLDAGLHFKLPWPIDKIYRYPTYQIQSAQIGETAGTNEEASRVLVWTVPHASNEVNFLVASREQLEQTGPGGLNNQTVPVNLTAAHVPVQFEITNLVQWAYNYQDAGGLLEKLATREVVRYLVSVDLDKLMSSGRLLAGQEITRRIQAQADRYHLGIHVLFAGFQDIHPPVKVAAAYEAVIGAFEEKEAKILKAEGYQAQTVPHAYAQASQITNSAAAYRLQQVDSSAAIVSRFNNRATAFEAAPRMFEQYTYLDTLSRTLADLRKYFIGTTNTHNVYIMDLKQSIRPDLLNSLRVPAMKGSSATNTSEQ